MEPVWAERGHVRASDPDADIIEAARGGSLERALGMLMNRHGVAVFKFCSAALRDPARVDDVHQEVFIQAHRDLAAFAGHSLLRTWLFAIARHRVLDDVRRELRRRRRREREELLEVVEEPPEVGDRYDAATYADALTAALGELPDEIRTAVLLRYQLGLGYPEMAAMCGERPGTLQARVARAMVKLHEGIVRRLPPWS